MEGIEIVLVPSSICANIPKPSQKHSFNFEAFCILEGENVQDFQSKREAFLGKNVHISHESYLFLSDHEIF